MVGCNSGRATPFLRRNRPSAIPNHQPRRNATYHSREAVQTTEASSPPNGICGRISMCLLIQTVPESQAIDGHPLKDDISTLDGHAQRTTSTFLTHCHADFSQ